MNAIPTCISSNDFYTVLSVTGLTNFTCVVQIVPVTGSIYSK